MNVSLIDIFVMDHGDPRRFERVIRAASLICFSALINACYPIPHEDAHREIKELMEIKRTSLAAFK